MMERIKRILLGDARDPMKKETRSHIALTAFFAWVGLGADGLSSSCYGPQEAFLALGIHSHLALYLAILTAITVFIISFAYNQVIELFPNGGGGYKMATQLLGPHMGVVAGSALIVDYVLTIVISIASGTDAFFSLLPYGAHVYKLKVEAFFILLLMFLNLRGMKESIKILVPIFLGFVFTHAFMIIYGIVGHGSQLPILVKDAIHDSHMLGMKEGTLFVVALVLRAY
jgi:amino acid transporter